MGHLGSVFQIYALISGVAACVFYIPGVFKNFKAAKYGLILRLLQLFFITASILALQYAIFHNDFSIAYAANYSDRSLPPLYKIASLWGGPEGYFLFLSWVAALAGVIEAFRLRGTSLRQANAVNLTACVFPVALTFLTIFIFAPFKEMDFTPPNGSGLDPLMQNIPSVLYTVFGTFALVSSFMIYAWTIGAMALKDSHVRWFRYSIGWIYALMIFITLAVFFGGLLAFNRISHTGYWEWDSLEVISAAAFILSAALLHSSLICLGNGRKKRICFFLPFLIFELLLLFLYMANSQASTYIVTFERSRGGPFVLGIMAAAAFVFIPFFVLSYKKLGSLPALVTRPKEAAVNAAITIVLTAVFLMLSGVIFQLVSGDAEIKYMLWHPFYYASVAFAASVLAVGVMGWYLIVAIRCGRNISKTAVPLYAAAMLAAVASTALFFEIKVLPAVFICLTVFSAVAMLVYIIREGVKSSFPLLLRKRRFYVRALTHLGFLIACLGVALSTSYYKEYYAQVKTGGYFGAGPYNFLVSKVDSLYKDNYLYTFIDMEASYKGRRPVGISPQIRSYNNSNKLYAYMRHLSFFPGVASIAFIGYDFKTGESEVAVLVYPYAWLIPIGFLILVLGTLYAALAKRSFYE